MINKIEEIANKRGVPMAEIAVAWSMQSPWVTAPIVGIKSTERLDELIRGVETNLTQEEINEINEPYLPVKIRGHT